MAYPAFIVAAFETGVPLKISEHFLYLAACAFSAWLVARLSRSHWLSVTLFGCLAFNPILWSPDTRYGAGVLLAAFWLTREERIWLFPALAFLALVAAVEAGRARGVRGIAAVLWLGAIPLTTFGSILAVVGWLNYRHYGAFTLNEI